MMHGAITNQRLLRRMFCLGIAIAVLTSTLLRILFALFVIVEMFHPSVHQLHDKLIHDGSQRRQRRLRIEFLFRLTNHRQTFNHTAFSQLSMSLVDHQRQEVGDGTTPYRLFHIIINIRSQGQKIHISGDGAYPMIVGIFHIKSDAEHTSRICRHRVARKKTIHFVAIDDIEIGKQTAPKCAHVFTSHQLYIAKIGRNLKHNLGRKSTLKQPIPRGLILIVFIGGKKSIGRYNQILRQTIHKI
mmetsp:Transcript_388/g.703  ORF Transcript_388/g.703 Transcript_388/m.703 type:complete len:243 (+) Transcript_388:57-785(+)